MNALQPNDMLPDAILANDRRLRWRAARGFLAQRLTSQENSHSKHRELLSSFHPPSTIVIPTIAMPRTTIARPTLPGRNPE